MGWLWNLHGLGALAAVALLTLIFAAAIALLALWVTLPAAVLGVRNALRDLTAAQTEGNRELVEIRRNLERLHPCSEKPDQDPGDG